MRAGEAHTFLDIRGCSAYASDASPRRLSSPKRQAPQPARLAVGVQEQDLERMQHQALRALIDQCSPAVKAAADAGARTKHASLGLGPVAAAGRPCAKQLQQITEGGVVR